MRRRLAAELEREGVSAAGFSVLVVLTTAGRDARAEDAATPARLVEGQRHGGHGHAGGPRPRGAPAHAGGPPHRARRAQRRRARPRGAPLPGPLRPRHARLRRPRRGREAHAVGAVPEARAPEQPAALSDVRSGPPRRSPGFRPGRPAPCPIPTMRKRLDSRIARWGGEAIQRPTVRRGWAPRPVCMASVSPAERNWPATAIRAPWPKKSLRSMCRAQRSAEPARLSDARSAGSPWERLMSLSASIASSSAPANAVLGHSEASSAKQPTSKPDVRRIQPSLSNGLRG